MGDPRGFIKVSRETFKYRPVCERVKDYNEIAIMHEENRIKAQASRCMDCGTPFCNWGCPLGNYIPEWNDRAYQGNWKEAFVLLSSTNNLPEITGRVCPAPCEYACVLGINDNPVTIKDNEYSIIEEAFLKGLVKPEPPLKRSGKKVAVIGSGPAGMSASAQLNSFGHEVTLFEKDEKIGGITRFGIPDFKLGKNILDRRIKIWEEEGIKFRTGINAGVDYPAGKLLSDFDAVCITIGCGIPRDMDIPGRDTDGVFQAMDYLKQSNRRVSGENIPKDRIIDAKGKKVLVIGGGDTGADCVGTANRQGAQCVVQIEILPEPPKDRPLDQPWPKYPFVFKTSTSHEEGVERKWSIQTKEFISVGGTIKKVKCARVEFVKDPSSPRPVLKECPGTDFEIEADLVILAMGFTNPVKEGLLEGLNVKLDGRGSIERNQGYMTSVDGVFSAGDASRGPSLIVWAIMEGRAAAENIDKYLSK